LREWEVSEFSLANYCALAAKREPAPMVALPVFPSRVFRHSSIFIREDSDVREPAQLAGRRVGIPQWSQTATVYVRGYLAHDVGIPLSSIEWVQAGVNEPGRKEPAKIQVPSGIRLRPEPTRTLSDMLLKGEIDAVITARPPEPFTKGEPGIRRLFPDFEKEEESYFRRTGIFPIMHVMVVRRDAYERNRWIMRNLFDAFEAAKRAAVPRLYDITTAFVPAAWGSAYFERVSKLIFPDGDPWPYGIERNRTTLDAFLLYCFEQGITERHLSVEELFAPEFNFTLRI
jgi:4,5-dihydroxyphthalate decarboxylase